jgi:hypothetical protein
MKVIPCAVYHPKKLRAKRHSAKGKIEDPVRANNFYIGILYGQ